MTARIYKPARTAMQSGTAKTKEWVLDYEPEQPRAVEPLMGWTSSGDMKQQLRLYFDTKEEADRLLRAQRHRLRSFREHAAEAAAHFLFRQFRRYAARRLDALSAARRLKPAAFPSRCAARPCAARACEPARWRNSDTKRSSGIGWPSKKPWP